MRVPMLLVPIALVALACGRGEAPATDSAAPAAAPAPMLSEAQVAGTWSGVAMLEGTDSVVARWTQVCANGTCRGTAEGQADTTTSTYRIEGDSSIGVSAAYMDPMFKANVIDTWVARVSGDSVMGTSVIKLADRDSVVARTQFRGARVSQ